MTPCDKILKTAQKEKAGVSVRFYIISNIRMYNIMYHRYVWVKGMVLNCVYSLKFYFIIIQLVQESVTFAIVIINILDQTFLQ